MREIKLQALTREDFALFGEYYAMNDPNGLALCGELHKFYPDRVTADSQHRIGFSPITVRKPAEYVITAQEYHTTTWEMILPLDDDMVLHVAQKSNGVVNSDNAAAFLVPKNTLVKLSAGVWHLAPLPANNEEIHCLISLPECTYANDCTVVELPEDQQFRIVR